MFDGTLTTLQKDERAALTGDRAAVIRIVSGLRAYRAAVAVTIDVPSQDGRCDAVALDWLAEKASAIETGEEET